MRHIALPLAATVSFFTAACSPAGPTPAPTGTPAAVTPTTSTATSIEGGGVRVDFAPGTPITKLEVLPGRATEAAAPLQPVTVAVAMQSKQFVFQAPITITLPVDTAKLPAGADASWLHPILLLGDMREELDAPVTLSADRKTATFQTDRLIPLANDECAHHRRIGPRAEPNDPAALIGADTEPLTILDTSPTIEISCARSAQNDALPHVAPAKAIVQAALARYQKLGFLVPKRTRVCFVDFGPKRGRALADATGGERIRINAPAWPKQDPAYRETALAHECFHLVQQTMEIQNLRAGGHAIDNAFLTPTGIRWFAEGTAEFMATRCYPDWPHIGGIARKLDFRFGYRSLTTFDHQPDEGSSHQYQAYIFFEYFNSLYGAAEITRQCCDLFASKKFVAENPAYDKSMDRGPWSMMDVLAHVLASMPDRLGRTRKLDLVFADFLVSLYCTKDFYPLTSLATSGGDPVIQKLLAELNGPRQLRLPEDCKQWSIPDGDVVAKTDTMHADSWCIGRVYRIGPPDKKNPRANGDLTIRIDTQFARFKDQARIVVLPYKGGLQAAKIGGTGQPIVLRDWQTHDGAVIWALDLTRDGNTGMTVTAEIEPRGAWFVDAFEEYDGKPIGEGASVTLPASGFRPHVVHGVRETPGVKPPARVGKHPPFHLLRITFDDGAPHYWVSWEHIKFPTGTHRVKYETIDDQGNAAASLSFTVNNTTPGEPDKTAELQNAIAMIEARTDLSAPTRRQLLCEAQIDIAYNLHQRFLHQEAWAVLESVASGHAEALQDEWVKKPWLSRRSEVAFALGKTQEYVASLEELAQLQPGRRSELLTEISNAWIYLANDVGKSAEYYQRFLDSLPPEARAQVPPIGPFEPR